MTDSSLIDKSKYRPNVAIVLINDEGLVLAGERIDIQNAWQLPQGGVDEDEDIKTAALRELEEETGIKASIEDVLEITKNEYLYDFPKNYSNTSSKKNMFIGQRQTFVLVKYNNSKIDLSAATDEEFKTLKWFKPKTLANATVLFRKASYLAAFKEFNLL